MSRFNIDLERDIIAQAIQDKGYRERARRVLDRHAFTDRAHAWLWGTIAALPAGDDVTDAAMEVILDKVADADKREVYGKAFHKLSARTPGASSTSLTLLGEFVRNQHMTSGIDKAIKALKDGDLDAAAASMRRGLDAETPALDSADWIEEWDDRTAHRAAVAADPGIVRRVPTHLRSLDGWLNGGLAARQLGLIVGTTGRGKSHFSTHLGFWGAAKGFNVLHVSTEMASIDVATRYDAKLAGISSSLVEAHTYESGQLESVRRKVARIAPRLKGKLKIVATPLRKANLDLLTTVMDDMTSEGRPPDLLIMDCGDHLQPSKSYRDYRLDQSNNYWDLKSLAMERDIPVWSTTQAPKEVVERIASSENVADSYDKARIADVIWTLNQSQSEYHAGTMRGFLAKNRKGVAKKMLSMKVDLSMSHYEELAVVTPGGGGEDDDKEDNDE